MAWKSTTFYKMFCLCCCQGDVRITLRVLLDFPMVLAPMTEWRNIVVSRAQAVQSYSATPCFQDECTGASSDYATLSLAPRFQNHVSVSEEVTISVAVFGPKGSLVRICGRVYSLRIIKTFSRPMLKC